MIQFTKLQKATIVFASVSVGSVFFYSFLFTLWASMEFSVPYCYEDAMRKGVFTKIYFIGRRALFPPSHKETAYSIEEAMKRAKSVKRLNLTCQSSCVTDELCQVNFQVLKNLKKLDLPRGSEAPECLITRLNDLPEFESLGMSCYTLRVSYENNKKLGSAKFKTHDAPNELGIIPCLLL